MKEFLDEILVVDSRRGLFTKAIVTGAAVGLLTAGSQAGAVTRAGSDLDILNFALNLEYLEGEFYTRALGSQLPSGDIGSNPGTVTGGSAVPFQSPLYQQFCEQVASDEQHHVEDLRAAITAAGSTPVDRPTIDFTAGFTDLATAAGLPAGFNPFADEVSFLLGSFVFEDVGVTAYTGAAALISNKSYLTAAAEILGVEAYHAGAVRAFIAALGGNTVTSANAIAAARATVDGTGIDDIGVTGPANTYGGDFYFADASASAGLTTARTTTQVLKIVYAGGSPGVGGGFFPNGLNGNIR